MISEIWKKKIQLFGEPIYYKDIHQVDYKEFENKITIGDHEYINFLIERICRGYFILVKNAFSEDFVDKLKYNVKFFWKDQPENFNKLVEGCKDFHRSITPEIASNYSVNAVKHATFFFPWNNDPCDINLEVFKRWDLVKKLNGFNPSLYRNNTPKDLVVDRIQIAVYPPGFGELEVHSDPVNNTRIATSIYLSSYKNKNFNDGGCYFIDKNKNKINIEKYVDVGDMGMFFGEVLHGVDAIDNNTSNIKIEEYDWNSGIGRWFMGLNSIDSDVKAMRITSEAKKEVNLS